MRARSGAIRLASADRDYPLRLLQLVCALAGAPEFLADAKSRHQRSLSTAIERHDTAALFDWLLRAFSDQGIADRVADDYMARHGRARWARIGTSVARKPSCPKLAGYWTFYHCRYLKGAGTCAEPRHIDACPLPRQPLRNGHLNQMAYSLFLFVRDVADGDFVDWIDRQLAAANSQSPDRLSALREAIIGPLRNVYGVGDKVLAMALSSLLLSAGPQRPLWRQVGLTLVAVDSLVHNVLHRTGVLQRLNAEHAYGVAC